MENTTKPLYKRKILVIPLAMIIIVALVSAAVLFATSHVTVTVSEALTTVDVSVAPSGYPGETISQDITIDSASGGDIPITLSWSETLNDNNVVYTYTGPENDTLEPGANVITLTWDITTGSPTGDFEGDITLTRI